MFEDLSEHNDEDFIDPFSHTNFLNKLSSNLENQTHINFSLPSLERKSNSKQISVTNNSNAHSTSINQSIKDTSVPDFQKRPSGSFFYKRPSGSQSQTSTDFLTKSQRKLDSNPDILIPNETIKLVSPSSNASNKPRQKSLSPTRSQNKQNLKAVSQIYFNTKSIKCIDSAKFKKMSLETDQMKINEQTSGDKPVMKSQLSPQMANNKLVKFKAVLLNDFVKGSTKNLMGILKGGLFNGSLPKPPPTKGTHIIAQKRKAIVDPVEKEMGKTSPNIHIPHNTSHSIGITKQKFEKLDVNKLCIDLRKQCSLLVDGAPKHPKMLANHKRALSEIMSEELIPKNDKVFSGKSKDFANLKLISKKTGGLNFNLISNHARNASKKVEIIPLGMTKSQVFTKS